ncbi:thrombomodulin-like [Lampetra fluviatilis]
MVALLLCLASLLLGGVCATPATFVSCSGNSCYSLVKHQPQQHVDFNAALTACERTGGHLATVDTEGEAELLGRLMRAVEDETYRSASSPRSSSPSSRKSSRAPEYWMGLRRKGCRMDMKGPLRGFSWLAHSEAHAADSHYENWLEQSLTSCTRELCASLVLASVDAPPGWKSRFCKSQAVQGFVCEHPVGVRVASGCGPLPLEQGLRASAVRTSAGTARYVVPWDDGGAVSPLGMLPVGSKAVVVCGATFGGDDGGDDDDDYDDIGGGGGGDVADGMANAVCSRGAGGDAEWKVSEPLPCLLKAIDKELSSSASSSSSMSPTCPPGFELVRGQCEDVDECARDDPCQQQGLCTNKEGGFVCDCVEGYQLVNLTECEDIDECDYEPCDDHCVNTDGSYECTCPRGYQQDKSGLGCHDTDECDLGAHACHHVCNNTEGSYECSCDEGWRLEADNVTCTHEKHLLESTTTTTTTTTSTTTTTTDWVDITPTESPPNLAFHVLLPIAIALVLVVIVVCAVAMVLLCCRGSGKTRKRRRQEEEEEQAPQGEKKNEYVWLATQGAAQGVKEMPRPSAPTQVHHEGERELKPRGPDDVDETRHSTA